MSCDYYSCLFGMVFFFFFKQKTAYEIMPSLVGSEMCIRDRYQRRVHGNYQGKDADPDGPHHNDSSHRRTPDRPGARHRHLHGIDTIGKIGKMLRQRLQADLESGNTAPEENRRRHNEIGIGPIERKYQLYRMLIEGIIVDLPHHDIRKLNG
eukprot:TRINITY_DN32327_c0_g1_i1.p3 TRINITY_DN32327_c0_g1~~TRINITY_DN32327_c0_g1_i1.p3  ORF type:complete len:152 (+),score=4.44 TRINITY_DN32327_c0_g1_i1:27-482(+)